MEYSIQDADDLVVIREVEVLLPVRVEVFSDMSTAAQPTALHVRGMQLVSQVFSLFISLLGAVILVSSIVTWNRTPSLQYVCYFALAVLASVLKVGWVSRAGTLSVNLLFILTALLEFDTNETILLSCVAAAAARALHPSALQTRFGQVMFSLGNTAVAVGFADLLLHLDGLSGTPYAFPLQLIVGSFALFIAHTFPPAAVEALHSRRSVRGHWQSHYLWQMPYYLVGALLASLMHLTSILLNWQTPMLIMPVVYLLYRSFRLSMERLQDGRKHAEELASLHLRTIEALALAIDAKDQTTHDHLRRVQVYALEVGKEMGLSESEQEALRAASLLHDIGKLAVPEHIISKPGKLTPEEFEKMKIHPIVGAEILERVKFPHPVVPIVRSHHEKWDGSGYPDGIKGEDIPVGARILAAVDCLDALASDRQYRKALPLDQAIGVVIRESGRSFDPRVVEILARRYVELEKLAVSQQIEPLKLSRDIKIEAITPPGAGYEVTSIPNREPKPPEPADFLGKIAAARQEAHALYELAHTLGTSLSLDETFSVAAVRLRKLVPFDAMAVYLKQDDKLLPEFVNGENFRLFASLEIPIGQGLSGWVAENNKPILNGNPSVEPGYLNDPSKFSTLRATLAVPLEGLGDVLGVLALYSAEKDCYTRDHLRILQTVGGKLSLAVENALKYRRAEASATTDYLTDLPNTRSLFLHLDGELARCRRQILPLTVFVCDVDDLKSYNDQNGHLEGNKLLKTIARGLRSSCREYDYVARMGGDEFVVVLPGLDIAAASERIENLRRTCLQIVKQELGVDIQLSLGHAQFPETGNDAEELLAEADRQMYRNKRTRKSVVGPAMVGWKPHMIPPTTTIQ